MSRVIANDSSLPLTLSLYIIFFPIATGIIGESFIISDIFFLAFIFLCFIKILLNKKFTLISLDTLLLIFLASTAFGNHIATHLYAYLFEVSALVYMYVGTRFITNCIDTEEKLERFVSLIRRVFIIFLIFSAIIILLRAIGFNELTDSYFRYQINYKGFFRITNQLAIFLVCLWPLAIIGFSQKPASRFILYFIFFITLSYTASRSGFWIGLGQTLMIEAVLFRKNQSHYLLTRFCSLIAIILLVISIMATLPAMNRSLGNKKNAALTIDKYRVSNFRDAFNQAGAWVSGYGFGCFDQVYRWEVHNTPFSILVETGIAGLLAATLGFLIFLNAFLKSKSLQQLPLLKGALIISFLGMAGAGMVHYLLRTRSCWLVLAISLCIIKLQEKQDKICYE